ncbi:KGGVGR-motif variant AAA ATPase [Sphaerisporangium rhizosphaerae]|uniref:KGGVGR-motif variant AAA ATPase n=1 Tax=Sphaerisporangium rhizosphaerae TaxID=2269375 RepID=A0ABW2NTM5_9ACTN
MNSSAGIVRFDEARPIALITAREAAARGIDSVLIRDVLGRFCLALDDRLGGVPEETVAKWRTELQRRLGPYAAPNPVLLAERLFAAEAVFDSPRVVEEQDSRPTPGQGRIRSLDNTVVGEDWARVTTPSPEVAGVRTARVALYGFKGGVGRSTATFMLGKHLAEQGWCVLVVDLDLESPGSGPLLLAEEATPRYGLVDHLVESAVGNAEGLDLVERASGVSITGNGELWVAPARGRGQDGAPYAYVEKLNRIYADIPGSTHPSFADRLERAVSACEKAVEERSRRPDVILLDSRAGIHDIAAVAISRLCDLALLFGADNIQTWQGYSDLFTAWSTSSQAEAVREKLRMVASMVPNNRRADYLELFRDHAWTCFSMLYDDLPPDDMSGFNPSPEDTSAPHSPIPILFATDLVGLDGAASPGWSDTPLVQAAYDEFLNTATRLIIEGLQ